MSLQHERNPNLVCQRCQDCPFATTPLKELRGTDQYWQCLNCRYCRCDFDELLFEEQLRAFKEYTETGIRIRSGARLLLKDRDEADFAAIDYCVKLVQKRPDWDGRDVRPWFNTILRHTIIDHLRKLKTLHHNVSFVQFRERGNFAAPGLPEPESKGKEPINLLIDIEMTEEVWACLPSIKDLHRTIIALDLEDCPSTQIADILGMTPQAVYRERHRAIEHIRRLLKIQ